MAKISYGTGTDHEVDPISRIEGHLGVKVDVDAGGNIIEADAHGNLWRGFENFLLGREANDAITFTQRICGVCPVPHGHGLDVRRRHRARLQRAATSRSRTTDPGS